MLKQRLFSVSFSCLFLLIVSACAKTTPPAPTPLPTVNVSTVAVGDTPLAATTAPATSAVTPPAPTEAARPAQLILITESGEPRPALQATLQQAAQELGWTYALVVDDDPAIIDATAAAGGTVLVIDGPALAEPARQAATNWPAVYFISLAASEAEAPPANLVTFAGSRFDQLGFVAGMAAGLATEAQNVTAVTNLSVEGVNYRNGFLHGVRYTCPRCQLQYIDVFDVDNGGAEAAQTAALYASISSDVFFAAAGKAGEAALLAAAQRGAWVIGTGGDVYTTLFEAGAVTGAERVLTSVYFDPGLAVDAALRSYHQASQGQGASALSGQQPFSASNQALSLAPYRTEALNAVDQREIASALARLADGSLDTGIDPATGQER